MRAPLLALLLAACGGGNAVHCTTPPDVTGLTLEEASKTYPHLSAWCLLDAPAQTAGSWEPTPRDRVVPYSLQTPLFSDGATKLRTLWMPEGQSAQYKDDDADPITMPVGTIISKTFSFPADLRTPDSGGALVETRIIARTGANWIAVPYTWRADMSDADIELAGEVVPESYVDATGATKQPSYLIPGAAQCAQCHHQQDGAMSPIGPKVRNLNHGFDYGAGTENQLTHLASVGYLTGLPALAAVPQLIAASDSSSGTVEQRARAYLEGNCAHCHSESGLASNTGLTLWASNTDLRSFGVCKPPVAAGHGAGGLSYDIVPGQPDRSILLFRMTSVDPSLLMPPLGRSIVDDDGLALVRQWITEMPGTCP